MSFESAKTAEEFVAEGIDQGEGAKLPPKTAQEAVKKLSDAGLARNVDGKDESARKLAPPEEQEPEPEPEPEEKAVHEPEKVVSEKKAEHPSGDFDENKFWEVFNRSNAYEPPEPVDQAAFVKQLEAMYEESPLQAIQALVNQSLNTYHQNRVAPLENEAIAGLEDRALMKLSRKHGDITPFAPAMKQVLDAKPHLRDLPPEDYLEYAFLKAREGAVASGLIEAKRLGRNEAMRDVSGNFPTGAKNAGRSEARPMGRSNGSTSSLSNKEREVARKFGLDPKLYAKFKPTNIEMEEH